MPSSANLDAALQVLYDYRLAVYQALYFHRPPLTSPGGYPLKIEYFINGNWLSAGFLMVPHDPQQAHYTVHVRTPEEAVAKAQLIVDALAKNLTRAPHACCPLAAPRPCVCGASCDCVLHGQTCVGSHD
jgi:hypothetical protein